MITTFAFHETPPDGLSRHPRVRRVGGRGAVLTFPLARDDAETFDRQGYGGSRYGAVVMETLREGVDPIAAPERAGASLTLDTACVMRVRGTGGGPATGVVLFTLCDLAETDAPAFLAQFTAASAFMARRPGFRSARLYRERSSRARAAFVNVAAWTTVAAFVDAFSSDAFKRIIVGGFETRSRILVAPLPSAPVLEAAQ
ncbi:antibiotic biosynthesis monooxygenase family protein [Roseospira visakhapatnamensis]|uniref:Heme-degrading monooxygenase HmoA n=1 Tax=Roseospira visakhapatnamensis TaxID=390880 RepID=A0A7W6W9U7_9PROT|nr:antibiotic biosynthesis monooxygenase [Roseospira visakhapatnamensis]MBB4266510.1 heme-degrading monooxygenase HmoA [Roseospira visakhapatnamensis]